MQGNGWKTITLSKKGHLIEQDVDTPTNSKSLIASEAPPELALTINPDGSRCLRFQGVKGLNTNNLWKTLQNIMPDPENCFVGLNPTTSSTDCDRLFYRSVDSESVEGWITLLESTHLSCKSIESDNTTSIAWPTFDSNRPLSPEEEMHVVSEISKFLEYGETSTENGIKEPSVVSTNDFTTTLTTDINEADTHGYFRSYSIDALQAAAIEAPPKKILGSLLFEEELAILFAPTNVGKSIMAMTLAQNAATGKAFSDFLPMETEAMEVVYFDFELSIRQLGTRLKGADPIGKLNIELANPDFEETNDNVLDKIEELITATKPKLVVIDNLSALKQDNESASEIRDLVFRLKKLKTKYRLSMLLVAHTPKIPKDTPLELMHLAGSAQLSNLVDSVVAMGRSSKSPSMRYLKQLKVRSSEMEFDQENVILCEIKHYHDREDNGVYMSVCGTSVEKDECGAIDIDRDQRNSEIWKLHKQGLSGQQIADRVNLGKSQVNFILQQLKSEDK